MINCFFNKPLETMKNIVKVSLLAMVIVSGGAFAKSFTQVSAPAKQINLVAIDTRQPAALDSVAAKLADSNIQVGPAVINLQIARHGNASSSYEAEW